MFTLHSSTPHNRDTNKKLVKILHGLLEMDESAPFRKPVPHKALGLGDYKKIVKKPIDLNQIRRQNNESRYKTIEEALDDIQLCWQNCKLYNHASSEVYQQALNLEKVFWKMVQQNFPQIYSANELKIKQVEANEQLMAVQNCLKQSNLHEASQSQMGGKQEREMILEESSQNKHMGRQQVPDLQQSHNSKAEEENIQSMNQQQEQERNENKSVKSELEQEIKEQIKQPIEVSLKEAPTPQNISKLTAHMKTIEDKTVLEQVLQILFTYEKQNMVASRKGQMNFRVENMHLSTFYRICKVVKMEPDEVLQIIQ